MDAFWRKRDPDPVTPVNEFREEHYRRIAYANTKLDDGLLPGWKTERGRIYIMLGDPRSVEQFNMDNRLVTTEIWIYQGDTAKGLPPFFNLIFFKRMDTGEYRLYSPTADGPTALLRGRFGVEPHVAVAELNRVSPGLARASLSIETRAGGDLASGVASLDSEVTMMRIEESPTYAIRTDYLDGWERYGDRVRAEYSFNFLPSRGVVAVVPDEDGTPFVHFGIEIAAEDFSVATDDSESKFYSTLDVTTEVRDTEGKLVVAEEKESYIELSRSQLESIRLAPVAYQDSLPLIPGDYVVTVVLRNRVDTTFAVLEREVSVPGFTKPALSGHRARPSRRDARDGAQPADVSARRAPGAPVAGPRLHPGRALGDFLPCRACGPERARAARGDARRRDVVRARRRRRRRYRPTSRSRSPAS